MQSWSTACLTLPSFAVVAPALAAAVVEAFVTHLNQKSPLLAGLFALSIIGSGCTSNSARPTPTELSTQLNEIDEIDARVFDKNRPDLSQQSINEALRRFKISLPADLPIPKLDESLRDRGLTLWHPFGSDTVVKIGPPAFDSWGLLGSTLAHEIEVHCRQNLLTIAMSETFGFNGKRNAEREAYAYELKEASRFGLTQNEIDVIAATAAEFN